MTENGAVKSFTGRIFVGVDVESGNPDWMRSPMSIGIAVIDETLRLLFKETVFLPFHKSQISELCKTEFWDRNQDIYKMHVDASHAMGYDPESERIPTFFKSGTKDWEFMKERVGIIEKIIADLEISLENSRDTRIIEFFADHTFDYESINYLLSEIAGTPPIQKRRLSNGNYQQWPLITCHNSDSQLSLFDIDHLTGSSMWVSTDSVLNYLGTKLPKDMPLHDHNPSNDAHKTVIEQAVIYNYIIGTRLSEGPR